MSQQIDAIYENGVLKPLEPLHLPEQMRVKLTLDTASDTELTKKNEAQRKALQDLWQELDASPQATNDDDWSAANHDDLLYDRDA